MAQALRIDRTNLMHHALSRGNEKNRIFYDENDKEKFTELLGKFQKKV
jgi:hypothetical protein